MALLNKEELIFLFINCFESLQFQRDHMSLLYTFPTTVQYNHCY